MRVFTKAIYAQDAHGLRKSANLYFVVSIAMIVICIICYNTVNRLPVVQYYKDIKLQASKHGNFKKITETVSQSALSEVVRKIKWYGFGIFLINLVTLSIFPGYITDDVHSEALKDWYPIILIVCCDLFGLVGNFLPSVYLPENANVAVYACIARLMFYPLFYGCLHGPQFFRTEIPVTVLTCFLGLTHGYLNSVLMILAPKAVPLQHSEAAGIVLGLIISIGLAVGSIVSWLWVL